MMADLRRKKVQRLDLRYTKSIRGSFDDYAGLGQLNENSPTSFADRALGQISACVQSPTVLAIAEIILRGGLRINDALGVIPSDVMFDGSLMVRQGKGSQPISVVPIVYRQFWFDFAKVEGHTDFVFSDKYFYRLFKKLGIYGKFGTNGNNSVTHYARHIRALSVSRNGIDTANITRALGHNSSRTASYYAKKERKE